MPGDAVVLRMAEAAGQQIICYWHLLKKSHCAQRVLPDVRTRTLPEAVLNLICRLEDFERGGLEELKRLAADGKISGEEIISYGEALQQMRDLIAAAYELEYADLG